MNLLRLGEEEEGKTTLEKAFSGDPFNVLNKNTLTLMDSFENFEHFDIPNFKVKLHKKESAALRPYVTDLLQRAYNTLSEKYHFKPEGPITFEMYPDHADFAVRPFGLPGIAGYWVSASELCDGFAASRKPDSFNWGSTLWRNSPHHHASDDRQPHSAMVLRRFPLSNTRALIQDGDISARVPGAIKPEASSGRSIG